MADLPLKILVIRFSSIGDIVLTTPVLRGLKQQIGAEVHFLTKPTYTELLDSNPNVDKIHTLDHDFSRLLSSLKEEAFDQVIDLHHNLRTLSIKQSLGVPAKAFKKLNVEKWLMTNLKINRLPKVHIVDRYLETVAPLGVKNDGQGLDFFFADPTPDDASHIRRTSADSKPEAPFIAFAIGAAHTTKRLTDEKIKEICKKLEYPIHLLGGPGEQTVGDTIAKEYEHVVSHCGSLSIGGSAEVMKSAHLVISHDTGMMHIAAALRKPILSIWGNTVPEFGMYPYYPAGMDLHQRFEVSNLSCRPCSKIGYKTCPKGHFRCMKQQDVQLIVEQARRALESAKGPK